MSENNNGPSGIIWKFKKNVYKENFYSNVNDYVSTSEQRPKECYKDINFWFMLWISASQAQNSSPLTVQPSES